MASTWLFGDLGNDVRFVAYTRESTIDPRWVRNTPATTSFTYLDAELKIVEDSLMRKLSEAGNVQPTRSNSSRLPSVQPSQTTSSRAFASGSPPRSPPLSGAAGGFGSRLAIDEEDEDEDMDEEEDDDFPDPPAFVTPGSRRG